MLLKNSTLM